MREERVETTLDIDIQDKEPPIQKAAVRSPSAFYEWYCLFVLLGIYVNSFLDRSILGLLVGPIRGTMGLSDSQIGFLMGPAFAVFYTIAGLPLGWLADRMSRVILIGVGQVFWAVATVSFGLGRTWTHLAIARSCVGVGEASLTPAAYSLIADIFPAQRLGRALSIYGMGIYIGGGLASMLGGFMAKSFQLDQSYRLPLIGEHLGWQLVFFMVALPSIPLTLLLFTLREPARRGQLLSQKSGAAVKVPLAMFVRYAGENRGTLLCHTLGFSLLALSGYGTSAWIPEFFIRLHEWTPARVGAAIGLVTMIFGPLGIMFGGWWGDRLMQKGHTDSKLRVSLMAALAWLPFGVAGPLMPSGELALLCLAPALFFSSMHWGIAPAAIQEIMPNQMRGQASALYLFVINLIGLGLGPMTLALVTDFVFQNDQQIHLSLVLTTTAATLLAIVCLAMSLSRFRASRQRYEAWTQSQA
jgi:MFS family permease